MFRACEIRISSPHRLILTLAVKSWFCCTKNTQAFFYGRNVMRFWSCLSLPTGHYTFFVENEPFMGTCGCHPFFGAVVSRAFLRFFFFRWVL
jgi:hypothetical protein